MREESWFLSFLDPFPLAVHTISDIWGVCEKLEISFISLVLIECLAPLTEVRHGIKMLPPECLLGIFATQAKRALITLIPSCRYVGK